MNESSSAPRQLIPRIEVVFWFAAAFVARYLVMEFDALRYDELYHVLAARSWASEGTFRIADGEYTRSALYTILLGSAFKVFGGSLTVGRMISVLAGTLLVVSVFVWTRRTVGRGAAWIAAALLCLSPPALFASQFIRFYSLHALLFWLVAIAWYALVVESLSVRARAALVVWIAAGLAMTLHLQVITGVGLVALALWTAIVLMPDWLRRVASGASPKWPLWSGLAAITIAAVILVATGQFSRLLALYLRVLPWAGASSPLRYHWMFATQYPTFWALTPLAALIALVRRPTPGLFCTVMAGVAFVIHTFAGMRGDRYIAYALPFFFVLWGIGLAELLRLLPGVASAAAARLGISDTSIGRRIFQGVTVAAVIAFLVINNAISGTAVRRSLAMMVGEPYDPHVSAGVNWEAGQDTLLALAADADVVLTTNAMKSLFYLGDYDFEVNTGHLLEIGGEEFTVDSRAGRPTVSSDASVALLIRCNPSGLFVSDDWRWRLSGVGIGDPAADVLDASTTPVDLPEEWGLRVFTWQHDAGDGTVDCPERAIARP